MLSLFIQVLLVACLVSGTVQSRPTSLTRLYRPKGNRGRGRSPGGSILYHADCGYNSKYESLEVGWCVTVAPIYRLLCPILPGINGIPFNSTATHILSVIDASMHAITGTISGIEKRT